MMKLLLTLSAALFLAGCNSLSDTELWLKIEQAKAHQNWDSTMTVSRRLLEEYPNGRYAGAARFALAESHRFLQQPREAVDHYKLFVERYPDLQPHAVSLFLLGYLYGNHLQNYDSARWYYGEFLKKYPQHELVPSIKLELESMGQSPQQTLEEQMEKNRNVSKR